jgi:hypothetical protein
LIQASTYGFLPRLRYLSGFLFLAFFFHGLLNSLDRSRSFPLDRLY